MLSSHYGLSYCLVVIKLSQYYLNYPHALFSQQITLQFILQFQTSQQQVIYFWNCIVKSMLKVYYSFFLNQFLFINLKQVQYLTLLSLVISKSNSIHLFVKSSHHLILLIIHMKIVFYLHLSTILKFSYYIHQFMIFIINNMFIFDLTFICFVMI